jgi:hypothetical protein
MPNLEQIFHEALEAGQNVLAVERVARLEEQPRSIGPIDLDVARVGVDDPDQADTRGEEVLGLDRNVHRPVVRRDHLDHEVGRDLAVTIVRALLGELLPTRKRDVGNANLVGIVRKDVVAALGAVHKAESMFINEIAHILSTRNATASESCPIGSLSTS